MLFRLCLAQHLSAANGGVLYWHHGSCPSCSPFYVATYGVYQKARRITTDPAIVSYYGYAFAGQHRRRDTGMGRTIDQPSAGSIPDAVAGKSSGNRQAWTAGSNQLRPGVYRATHLRVMVMGIDPKRENAADQPARTGFPKGNTSR